MPAYFVTLDPGQRTGVALWSEPERDRLVAPNWVSLWTGGVCRVLTWAERCEALALKLGLLLRQYNVSIVYCEMPAFFEGEKGHAAAAKGDVVKLAYLVGVYAGICHKDGVRFSVVPVREWKGQLPKPIVIQRVKRKLGKSCGLYRGDQWDAVGIGLYIKGFFK